MTEWSQRTSATVTFPQIRIHLSFYGCYLCRLWSYCFTENIIILYYELMQPLLQVWWAMNPCHIDCFGGRDWSVPWWFEVAIIDSSPSGGYSNNSLACLRCSVSRSNCNLSVGLKPVRVPPCTIRSPGPAWAAHGQGGWAGAGVRASKVTLASTVWVVSGHTSLSSCREHRICQIVAQSLEDQWLTILRYQGFLEVKRHGIIKWRWSH